MDLQALAFLAYTIIIATIFWNWGRLSTVGHPLRKAAKAPGVPQEPLSAPPPAQDPIPLTVVVPEASQEVVAPPPPEPLPPPPPEPPPPPKVVPFSWNPECPMCGVPNQVVMADENAFTQTWHCFKCNHYWRT